MTPIGEVWTFAVGHPATVDKVISLLRDEDIPATVFQATGVWEGEVEKSVVIKSAGLHRHSAEALARILRYEFKQDAIYVEANGQAWLETGRTAPTLEAQPTQEAAHA